MKDFMKLINNSIKLILLLLALTIFAEEAKNTKPPADDKKSAPAKDETLAMMKDYTPVPTLDPSFTVRGINFLRRAAHNGKGDVLDVQFSIENQEASTRDYSVYVLAYNEAKNPVFNTLAPPPAWRENDPNSKNTIIKFSVLAPEKITPKDVWGDAVLKQKTDKVESNKLKGYEAELGEPSLNDYMLYLSKKPDKALKFKLAGEAIEKTTVSNYESSSDELKRDMNLTAVNKHTYTIFNSKYKTTILTHHYSEFRPDFVFFNRVAILIFDKDNKLVYRTIQDIGKKREVK
jgi:hypothetical protein